MDKEQTYIARICWNSEGWKSPTGEASQLEQGSYVTRTGFGHEEWLFDYSKVVNGFHYAFLQPMSRSRRRLEGQSIRILLFAINPNAERVYVGELENCEVLSEPRAEEARAHYKACGWLEEMASGISSRGGDGSQILYADPATDLFNVRFRLEDGIPMAKTPCQPPRMMWSNPTIGTRSSPRVNCPFPSGGEREGILRIFLYGALKEIYRNMIAILVMPLEVANSLLIYILG